MWTLPVAPGASFRLLCSHLKSCTSGAPASNGSDCPASGVLVVLGVQYAMLSFGLTVLVRAIQLHDLRRTGPVQ